VPRNTDPYSENDDFCGCTGYGKLQEVTDVWSGNATPRNARPFSSAARPRAAAAASVKALCDHGPWLRGQFPRLEPRFNIDLPGFVWEGMVIAHEVGHKLRLPAYAQLLRGRRISDPSTICVDTASDDVANCLGDNKTRLCPVSAASRVGPRVARTARL